MYVNLNLNLYIRDRHCHYGDNLLIATFICKYMHYKLPDIEKSMNSYTFPIPFSAYSYEIAARKIKFNFLIILGIWAAYR